MSVKIAFLCAGFAGVIGVVLFEISSRRQWEHVMTTEMDRLHQDYERLVREVARHRNEVDHLRRTLADAGASAKRQSTRTPETSMTGGQEAPVEERMVKTIADQLSLLNDSWAGENKRAQENALEEETAEENPFVDTDDLNDLTEDQIIRAVHGAVRQDKMDVFSQPIVSLPQRKIRFYEMFSRIRLKPDLYIPAQQYITIAMEQNLLPAIDNNLLLRALQRIRDTADKIGASRAFFCNITSLTLNDPKFMADLVEFVAQSRVLAPRIVFELAQKDLATMSADTLPVLQGLARLGCRFSMDRVTSLSFDYAHLEARHIRFIKVDADLLLRALNAPSGLSRLKRLKSELDHQGIDIIVEKLEREDQVRELLDVGIDYGQGYLFASPEIIE